MCQNLMANIFRLPLKWTSGILNKELRDGPRGCSKARCLKWVAVELHLGTNISWLKLQMKYLRSKGPECVPYENQGEWVAWAEETVREMKGHTKDKAWCRRSAFLSELQNLALDWPQHMADVQSTEPMSRRFYSAEARRKAASSHYHICQSRKVTCLRPERNYIREKRFTFLYQNHNKCIHH